MQSPRCEQSAGQASDAVQPRVALITTQAPRVHRPWPEQSAGHSTTAPPPPRWLNAIHRRKGRGTPGEPMHHPHALRSGSDRDTVNSSKTPTALNDFDGTGTGAQRRHRWCCAPRVPMDCRSGLCSTAALDAFISCHGLDARAAGHLRYSLGALERVMAIDLACCDNASSRRCFQLRSRRARPRCTDAAHAAPTHRLFRTLAQHRSPAISADRASVRGALFKRLRSPVTGTTEVARRSVHHHPRLQRCHRRHLYRRRPLHSTAVLPAAEHTTLEGAARATVEATRARYHYR